MISTACQSADIETETCLTRGSSAAREGIGLLQQAIFSEKPMASAGLVSA